MALERGGGGAGGQLWIRKFRKIRTRHLRATWLSNFALRFGQPQALFRSSSAPFKATSAHQIDREKPCQTDPLAPFARICYRCASLDALFLFESLLYDVIVYCSHVFGYHLNNIIYPTSAHAAHAIICAVRSHWFPCKCLLFPHLFG